MKKFCSTLFLLLLYLSAGAGTIEEKIKSNPFFAAGPYHTYIYEAEKDTPAPSGYKPFYISHVGRHGSRCLADSDPDYHIPIRKLEECSRRRLLTPKGEKLLADMKAMALIEDDCHAQITEIGAIEHKEIASRMYRRFKPVWTNRARRSVRCKATMVPRCILSMANSTNVLKGLNTKLDFSFDASMKAALTIRPDTTVFHPVNRPVAKRIKEDFKKTFDPAVFYSNVFYNAEAASSITGNKAEFCRSVFDLWKDALCVRMDEFDARDYFSVEELRDLYYFTVDRWYEVFSSFADPSTSGFGIVNRLLADMLDGAEEAIGSGKICADLRYTHDSALLPLLFKIGTENYPTGLGRDKAREIWHPSEIMPMATNLQIVFYSKKGCETLVKLLFNERETKISGLEAVSGPYYKWSDVREILKKGIR